MGDSFLIIFASFFRSWKRRGDIDC